MSKEQLEDIKNNKTYLEGTNELIIAINTDDYDWLIEQAERVQELERSNKQLKNNLSVYKGYYNNTLKINKDVVEENKRHRQTLYFLELKLSDFKEYTNEIKKLSDEKMIKDYAVRFLEDISETEQALKEENK